LAYDVVWHEKVKADLGALTKQDASRILAKIKEHLLPDPGAASKPLKGVFKGLFKFGAYRIIFAVDYAKRRVIVLHVKHRKDAYRGRD
jgi:mRNA-degrading endonuclease RelE of RelBE toxin-antitoxin system